MTPLIQAAVTGLISASLREFVAWQSKRAQDASWKPSEKDVEDFLAEVSADTPEAVKARVAAALGVPWPNP